MNTWFKPDLPMVPTLWLVCFSGINTHRWWERFLKRGFRHVSLLGYVPDVKLWIWYEVKFHRTDIALVSSQYADLLLTGAMMEGGVLEWRGKPQRPSWGIRFGMWCVPAIKHVLGVRCVAVTPQGLHDWLIRNGANPLLPEESHESVRNPESATGRPGN